MVNNLVISGGLSPLFSLGFFRGLMVTKSPTKSTKLHRWESCIKAINRLINHGNLRYPPKGHPPPRNKALIRPYLLGGVALGGGTLDSHE